MDGTGDLGAASNLLSATNPKSDSQDNGEDSNYNSLECPICLQNCIHPVELPCSHIFCFLCIKGVAAQNPHSRCAICRQDIPNSVFTNPQLKDISQLYKNPTVPSGFQWFYESRSDGWWLYDERTMQELEKAFETKKSTFQMMIAGHMYEIDFVQMIQYRVTNPTMFRRIKRDLPTTEKRGIAGIRLNNKKSDGTNPTGATVRRGGSSASSRNRSSPSNLSDHQRVHSLSMPHLTSQVDGPPVFEVDTDSDEDVLEDEDDGDDLEEGEEEDDDEDMELGEEEGDENSDENDDESGGLRDGARAPTSRSDRSNSSTTHTTPPSTPSNGNGPYSNGQSGNLGSSRIGKTSRNISSTNNSNSTSSGNSSRNNSTEPIIVNLETESSLQLLQESNVLQSPTASNPSYEIDANVSNCNNIISFPQSSSPITSDNNQYLNLGPTLQIRFNNGPNNGSIDEIL